MVNRILIRIKVVQTLYSYLLTRRDFKIQLAPEKDTADARYAHWLYINLLLMIMELTGHRASALKVDSPILSLSKAGGALASDPELSKLSQGGESGIEHFDGVLQRLYDRILNSSIYKDIAHRKRINLEDNAQFWSVILQTVIATDPQLMQTARRTPGFTAVGFRQGVDMAVATLEDLSDARTALRSAQKQLRESLEKAYDLYMSLLQLPIFITRLEADRIEEAKKKYLANPTDLNPDLRFVENPLIRVLASSPELQKYAKEHPAGWDENYYLLKELLDKIKESQAYQEYMAAPEVSFDASCELWRELMRMVIFPSDALADALEAMSVYWNDDLAIMGTFVLKTLRQVAQNGPSKELPILPMYKDEDDERYGSELFNAVVENRETYRSYIDRFVKGEQWDPKRTTFMDIVILLAAIAELLNFPSIPVPVTVNEYVEIANYYSTPRSGQFVNGLLFSVINYLKANELLTK